MEPAQEKLLNLPIGELSLSSDLKALLQAQGFKNLNEVLQKEIGYHRKNNGVSFEQELELYRLIEANGLDKYWRE